MARIAALILLGAGLLTGCSDAGSDPEPQRTTSAPQASAQTQPAQAGAAEDCVPALSKTARSRDELVGLTDSDVTKAEKAAGHQVRVLGVDGECSNADDDLRPKRVNLVIKDGRVVWASMF